MAEVDRRLRTFEENARFMAEFNKFQGLKETKRRLTLQQTKETWEEAVVREAGAAVAGILLACVGMAFLSWLFVATMDYMFAPLEGG
mmetsp:Transcript_25405/g.73388  ORF Transcript_25405/g.73388 Transcript_25405/m.73388 type:complete len:87 (+) Transcript_25405:245-505(+)